VVPEKIRVTRPLDLPEARAERTTLSYLRNMADRNEVFTSMIGMGYYGTVTPKVILRNVLEKPRLVHGLYALPSRSEPGPPRSPSEFPTGGRRSHGPGIGQCLAS
jgi:hypothetical protein